MAISNDSSVRAVQVEDGYSLLWTRGNGTVAEAEFTWDSSEAALKALENRRVLWVWSPL